MTIELSDVTAFYRHFKNNGVHEHIDTPPTGISGFTAESGYSVSGDFSSLGNEVTITVTGGGFGTKPGGEKPVYVALWEDGYGSTDPDPDLSRDPGLSVSTSRSSVVSSPSSKVGGNSLEFTTTDTTSAGMVEFDYVSTGKEIWFAKRRTGFDSTDVDATGQKEWRLWNDTIGNHNMYFDSDGKITAERTLPSTLSDIGHEWNKTKNKWADEKCRILQGDVDILEARAWWVMDGAEIVSDLFRSQATGENTTDGQDHIGRYNKFVGPQDQKTGGTSEIPPGEQWWLGMLYFDDSWCHAVLSDSATFDDSGSTQEIQPVKAWTDGSVTIHARYRPGLTHLHIIDANYNSYYIGEAG